MAGKFSEVSTGKLKLWRSTIDDMREVFRELFDEMDRNVPFDTKPDTKQDNLLLKIWNRADDAGDSIEDLYAAVEQAIASRED